MLFVAFAAQNAGDALFGGLISGFFGAAAMTPVVFLVERLPNGPPKLVTFPACVLSCLCRAPPA